MLKKEIVKTQSKDLEKAAEYRQLLVQAVHSCAVKFPDVAGAVHPQIWDQAASSDELLLSNYAI